MTKRIIYQTPEGGVAIIVPSQEAIDLYGIQAVALKDVPAGYLFKLVNVSEIPEDRTVRAAWEADPTTLTDGIGAVSSEFPEATA